MGQIKIIMEFLGFQSKEWKLSMPDCNTPLNAVLRVRLSEVLRKRQRPGTSRKVAHNVLGYFVGAVLWIDQTERFMSHL